MILKQVIRYDNAVAIEATWVEQEITQAVGVDGEEGYQPEQVKETVVKSTAYAGNQMDLFRADVAQYGGDISLYEDLIAQVEADFVPEPPQPAPIPTIVSMRQARLALLQSGLLETVNQAIANGNEADKITWEYATEVQRTDVLVQNLATVLGLTEQDLDNLFLLASTL